MPLAIPRGTLAASTARLNGLFFSAAIFLCVTLLVGVTASAQFLRGAMEANARQLLAADLRLQASLPIRSEGTDGPLPTEVRTFAEQHLAGPGRQLSPSLEFSAMARVVSANRSLLVEVKAVASDYFCFVTLTSSAIDWNIWHTDANGGFYVNAVRRVWRWPAR
jgi:predicted lysophospholipase L1 biosynthesis ABC-type transport system permease subunit